jgi:hypothetical protein
LDNAFIELISSTDKFPKSILNLIEKIMFRHKNEKTMVFFERIKKTQNEIEKSFILYCRGIICSIIYINTLAYFGYKLFLITVLFFILSILLQYLGYQMIHVIVKYGTRLKAEIDRKRAIDQIATEQK